MSFQHFKSRRNVISAFQKPWECHFGSLQKVEMQFLLRLLSWLWSMVFKPTPLCSDKLATAMKHARDQDSSFHRTQYQAMQEFRAKLYHRLESSIKSRADIDFVKGECSEYLLLYPELKGFVADVEHVIEKHNVSHRRLREVQDLLYKLTKVKDVWNNNKLRLVEDQVAIDHFWQQLSHQEQVQIKPARRHFRLPTTMLDGSYLLDTNHQAGKPRMMVKSPSSSSMFSDSGTLSDASP